MEGIEGDEEGQLLADSLLDASVTLARLFDGRIYLERGRRVL